MGDAGAFGALPYGDLPGSNTRGCWESRHADVGGEGSALSPSPGAERRRLDARPAGEWGHWGRRGAGLTN